LTFQRLLTLLLAHHYGLNFKSQILPVKLKILLL
jgi:hypothetical protein